jgi:hypothetical protein
MAKIKNKVYIKPGPTVAPVLETLTPDNANILKIVNSTSYDPTLLHPVPYASQVVSQNLLRIVSELVYNDTQINNEILSTNELISEGVFNTVTKRELTVEEQDRLDVLNLEIENQNELDEYQAIIDAGGTLTTEQQDRYDDLLASGLVPGGTLDANEQSEYNYLISTKYGHSFDITGEDTPTISLLVSPGKFKVYEEIESNVYFITDPTTFNPLAISTEGYYRRDIIKAVFRNVGDDTTPKLIYEYGIVEVAPAPTHTTADRELTTTYGTFPLWSILYHNVAGITEIVRIDQIFDWVGLRALLEITKMSPHLVVENTYNLYAVNHWRDIALRDFSGQLLTPEYGESDVEQLIEYPDSPWFYIEEDLELVADPLQVVPNTFEPLYKGSLQTFPFVLKASYNNFIEVTEVEFRQLSIAMQTWDIPLPDAQHEGLELHLYTADAFCDETSKTDLNIIVQPYLTSGDIHGAPALPLGSIAFEIDGDLNLFTFLFDNNEYIYPATVAPKAGDFILITSGHGQDQISEILAIHSTDGIKKNVLVVKALKINVTSDGGLPYPLTVAIFQSATERLAGNTIKDEFGQYTAWYNALPLEKRQYIDYAYPFSTHTGITRLPWSANQLGINDLKYLYNLSQFIMGSGSDLVQINFNIAISLKRNKWYFIKSQVYQKPEPYDQYNDAGKPRIAYINPNDLVELQNHNRFNGWFQTAYNRNPGKYATIQNGKRIIALTDKYGDIQKSYPARGLEGKPEKWIIMARNLDPEIITYPTELNQCYIDVARGKFIFHPDAVPEDLRITCVIDNVINGRPDTENILHIESNSETITLASKLQDIEDQVNVLLNTINTDKIMLYRGPNSKILKHLNKEFNLLYNELPELGTRIYCCDTFGEKLIREQIDQQYPISRLFWSDTVDVDFLTGTDSWTYADANKWIVDSTVMQQLTINIFDNSTQSNSLMKSFPVGLWLEGDWSTAEDPVNKILFTISAPYYFTHNAEIKRIGLRICDWYGNIYEDLGIPLGVDPNAWTDYIYCTIHNASDQCMIPNSELGGDIIALSDISGPVDNNVIRISKTKVLEIYNNFNKYGALTPSGGYQNLHLQTPFINPDEIYITLPRAGESTTPYTFAINDSQDTYEYLYQAPSTTDVPVLTLTDLMLGLNVLTNDDGFRFTFHIGDSAMLPSPRWMRWENLILGDDHDAFITTPSVGNDLFVNLGSLLLSGGSIVAGKDSSVGLTPKQCQDKMWIYFELNDIMELPNTTGDEKYHVHIFVKVPDGITELENVLRPNVTQYNDAEWKKIEKNEPFSPYVWKVNFKLHARSVQYDNPTYEYTGKYNVGNIVPKLIDIDENLIIPVRNGKTGDDVLNTSLAVSDIRYNFPPDMYVVDIMPAILDAQGKWDSWQYYNYIGMDIFSGRIKLPNEMPIDFPYNFDEDLIFGVFNALWPYTHLTSKSFGDPEDPGISIYDRKYSELRTRDNTVRVVDDEFGRGRVEARSIFITWQPAKTYKIDDLITVGNKLYRCLIDHTSSAQFITDVNKWSIHGDSVATIHDVNVEPDTISSGPDTLEHGSVVRYDKSSSGNNAFGWLLAQANDYDNLALAIISKVTNTQNFTVMTDGYASIIGQVVEGIYTSFIFDENDAALEPNTWYYLSYQYPGKITKNKPALAQKILFTLGPNNPDYPALSSNAWVTDCLVAVDERNIGAVERVEEFIAQAEQLTYTLVYQPLSKETLDITMHGITQHFTTFDLMDKVITFSEPLLEGMEVRIKYAYRLYAQPGVNIETQTITATAGQTIFEFNELTYIPITKASIILSDDGTIIADSEYSILAKTVTLNSGATVGHKIKIQSFVTMNVIAPMDNSITASMIKDGTIDGSKIVSNLTLNNVIVSNNLSVNNLEVTGTISLAVHIFELDSLTVNNEFNINTTNVIENLNADLHDGCQVLNDDLMTANSDDAIPTQGNVVQYVYAQITDRMNLSTPLRQTILQAQTTIDTLGGTGQAVINNALSISGAGQVTLNANTVPFIFTIANGFDSFALDGPMIGVKNYNHKIDVSQVPVGWNFSAVANGTYHLYIDSGTGGVLTYGYSLIAPVYSLTSIAAGQPNDTHYFNIPEMKMYRSNGSIWVNVNRIFVGVVTKTAGPAYTITNSAINGQYVAKFNIPAFVSSRTTPSPILSFVHNIGVDDWLVDVTGTRRATGQVAPAGKWRKFEWNAIVGLGGDNQDSRGEICGNLNGTVYLQTGSYAFSPRTNGNAGQTGIFPENVGVSASECLIVVKRIF